MSSETSMRRNFLKKFAVIGGALAISPVLFAKTLYKTPEQNGEEVSPNEDLMREHGALRRIILIYREAIHRIEDKQDLQPFLVTKSAFIIHNFIENYHEKLEENFLFPRFEKAGKFVYLVTTLKTQHQAGRKLTNEIIQMSKSKNFKTHYKNFINAASKFIYMYEPHAAREDTILFPAFQKIVSKNEYKELGEKFEYEEHKRFGKQGFEGVIAQIAEIEKELNIYDLAKFTP